MTDARTLLDAERTLVLGRLAALSADHDAVVAASLDTNADDEHDPEGATIAFERSQIGSLVRQARDHLAEIDAALGRLEDGSLRHLRGVRRGDPRWSAGSTADRPTLHHLCPRNLTSAPSGLPAAGRGPTRPGH